jgi:ubiquinone/menaquinone biosynthesis C-methylase UbiE
LHRKLDLIRSAAALIAAAIVLSAVPARSTADESEIDRLVQVLALKPGSSVADVGAGSGEFSIALAKRLGPAGTVYSTEVNPVLLPKIRDLVKKEGAQNVRVIQGKEHETELPPDCCDAIFLREVYHHLTDPIGMDKSLYLAMRPVARLAIIDFDPSQMPGKPAPPGVPANRGGHGVPERIVEDELTRTGFKVVKTMPWPVNEAIKHYCVLFVKPSLSPEIIGLLWPPNDPNHAGGPGAP